MIKIGISESDTNFKYYAPCVIGNADDIEIVILSYKSQNYSDLEGCNGLVLEVGDWMCILVIME